MSTAEQNKVLVIDDDEMVLTIIRKMLESDTFSVDVSLSAREALQRLPETRYNAILCDMWMPGMTGKDFYNQLRKQYPEYLGRIIFLTGDIASEATWDFIEERHLPYVLKPVSPPELRRKVHEVVGISEPEAAAGAKKGAEARRHKRVAMKASVRVTKKKWATGGPDIAAVVNASKDGVLFVSDRQYRVGMDVAVAFPYAGSNDVDQDGVVVRVDERSDGRRGVAVAVGESADMARAVLNVSDEQRQRDRILDMADLSGRTTAGVVASAASIDKPGGDEPARDRQEISRLNQELSNMKVVCDRAINERDRLASVEADYKQEARDLRSTIAALNKSLEDAKRELGRAHHDVEAAQADRSAVEAELRNARQEVEKLRDEKLQPQEIARAEQTMRSLEPSPPAAAEQGSDLQARLQEFRSAGIGPLTILGAYCDMLAMNKSLDESTRQMIEEISQQAAQLRNAFQKFFKK